MRSKAQISLYFGYHDNLKDFLYQILCVFSHIKDIKHIVQDFYSVAGVMPQGWDLGCWEGVSNTLAWGFAMAQYRLRVLVL